MSTGTRSLYQETVGTGFPVAEHIITVALPFSTAFSVGLSTIRGKPAGTAHTHTAWTRLSGFSIQRNASNVRYVTDVSHVMDVMDVMEMT